MILNGFDSKIKNLYKPQYMCTHLGPYDCDYKCIDKRQHIGIVTCDYICICDCMHQGIERIMSDSYNDILKWDNNIYSHYLDNAAQFTWAKNAHHIAETHSPKHASFLHYTFFTSADLETLNLNTIPALQRFVARLVREKHQKNNTGVNIVFYEMCNFINARLVAPAQNIQLNKFEPLFQPHTVSFNNGHDFSCSYKLHDKAFFALSIIDFMEVILPYLQKQQRGK